MRVGLRALRVTPGFVQLSREALEHPAVANPLRLAALVWLAKRAVWKPTDVSLGAGRTTLQPRQIAIRVRDLETEFGWAQTAARRFLDACEAGGLLKVEPLKAGNRVEGLIVTVEALEIPCAVRRTDVCTNRRTDVRTDSQENREDSGNSGAPTGAPPGAPTGGHKEEENNPLSLRSRESQNAPAHAREAPPDLSTKAGRERAYPPAVECGRGRRPYPAEFEAWWSAYPRHDGGKQEPYRRWRLAVIDDPSTVAAMLDGANRYRADCDRTGRDLEFIAQPATWLNQRRWQTAQTTDRSARHDAARNHPAVPDSERLPGVPDIVFANVPRPKASGHGGSHCSPGSDAAGSRLLC